MFVAWKSLHKRRAVFTVILDAKHTEDVTEIEVKIIVKVEVEIKVRC